MKEGMQCGDKTKGLKVIFESRNNQSKILLSFEEAMFNPKFKL